MNSPRVSAMIKKVAAFLIASHLSSFLLHAADWPQFLGPTRNGAYPGDELASSWPTDGPRVVWKKPIGQGFSSPVAHEQKLIVFHRLEALEVVECWNTDTGNQIWRFDYPTAYRDDFGFDPGPRATPAVDDGHVYTFGAEGMLNCLALADGKKVWSIDTKSEYHEAKGFFGIACSPLVAGNAVILILGGSGGAGITAFDKTTGKLLWKTSNDEASYSSPVSAKIGNLDCALCLTRSHLVALSPADGKVFWQFPFEPPIHASVTAAVPVVAGDLVFISACYDAGAAVLRMRETKAEPLWAGDDILSNHYANSVLKDGFLYGINGRTDPGFGPSPSLRCVEMKSGKILWRQDDFGAASVTLAGGQLLILTEKGELIRAPATPKGFSPNARAQILPFQVRSYPALANGRLYARSKDKMVCVELGKSPAK